jgi:hypothetical protein
MESNQISKESKDILKIIYESLNPSELKRKIDAKLKKLYEAYQRQMNSNFGAATKKLTTTMVSFNLINQR